MYISVGEKYRTATVVYSQLSVRVPPMLNRSAGHGSWTVTEEISPISANRSRGGLTGFLLLASGSSASL